MTHYSKKDDIIKSLNNVKKLDSEKIRDFIGSMDQTGFTYSFDWSSWLNSIGITQSTDLKFLDAADLDTLRKLATTHVSKERYSPGYLNQLLQNGYLDALATKIKNTLETDKKFETNMSNMIFQEIPQLTDNWWLGKPANDPAIVWTVWTKDTYYLWGANAGNYQQKQIGTLIGGGGLAGVNGPSRGRHHPNYVGVITMNLADMPKNDAVFSYLSGLAKNSKNSIVIPIYNTSKTGTPEYKFSLGTGIGSGIPNWGDIQKYVLQQIVALSKICKVTIPKETYWPDCRQSKPFPRHPMTSISDIQNIIDNVL